MFIQMYVNQFVRTSVVIINGYRCSFCMPLIVLEVSPYDKR